MVIDAVVDFVGIFTGGQDAFIPENRLMLRNIALGGANQVYAVLNADFLNAGKNTQNLESQRMSHRLEGS